MSRLLRALGLGGGGDRGARGRGDGSARGRPDARFDSPKVRRLRETMRWRGYDLSDYSDEQIAVVSARFPNDISEDGETTEAGRHALADALARGDFAAPAAAPPRERAKPAPRGTAAASAPPPSPAPRAGTVRSTTSERLLHVFGVHSWRRLDGDDGVSLRCAGCGQLRSAPAPVEPPPPPLREDEPPSPIAPPRSTMEPPPRSTAEPPPDPVERQSSAPDPVTPFEIPPRRQTGERPGPAGQRPPESPWQFFLGLPWWSKLIVAFIFMQVIIFIVQRIG